MESEIATMDGNRLLNTNVDNLVSYVVDKFRIDVPELDEANMTVDQREEQRDVSGDPRRMAYYMDRGGPVHVTGTEVIVEVPISGDAQMFKVRPSTYDTAPPRGEVRGNIITFRYWSDTPQGDQVKTGLNGWSGDVKRYLQWQHDTFGGFNDAVAGGPERQSRNGGKSCSPIKTLLPDWASRSNADPERPPLIRRRRSNERSRPGCRPSTTGAFKPEPVLEEAEYQHILNVIEGMVKVMERSPKAFHGINEEALRTHFLVQLNGHYEGQATGETFNFQGKTDILIRSGDRNIFIAECKFWSGPTMLTETIDQLLGYLSWRDSKVAVLLFNRNKDFSKVLDAVPETVKAHPNFQKDEGKRGETGFRYAFRHKDDAAKILHLTVMAFDVPRQAT